MRFHNPVVPLRTYFLYNNHMHTTAGVVAEQLGGDPWEALVSITKLTFVMMFRVHWDFSEFAWGFALQYKSTAWIRINH